MSAFSSMKTLCFFLALIIIDSKIFGQQIKMEKKGGVYLIPCKVNGLSLTFIFDTGASDVSISLSEAIFMLKNGYLKNEDFGEKVYYQIANGEVAEGTKIIIRKLEVGSKALYNVYASIVHNLSAPLLLGQTALQKLGKYSFDYSTNTLIIGGSNNSYSSESSIYNKSTLLYQASGVFFLFQSKLTGNTEKTVQEGKNVLLKYNVSDKSWYISYNDMDGLFQIIELKFERKNDYDAIMTDSHGSKISVTNGIKQDGMLFCQMLDISGDYIVYLSFEGIKTIN